jgi:riboflavin synthase alpha subunit
MFTGIIEEMGEVVSLAPTGEGSAVLTLRAGAVLDGLPDGGSLAVNGVCLTQAAGAGGTAAAGDTGAQPTPTSATTATDPAPASASTTSESSVPSSDASLFTAHVMGETLTRTTVGGLAPGDPVNLERCPRAGDRFDGHIVQGHVDGTGTVLAVVDEGDWVRVRIGLPSDLAPYTAEKGSIALDGISLTISAVSPAHPGDDQHWVEVSLIPVTLAATRMGVLREGDAVNVEVDVIAKYAARLTEFRTATADTPTTPVAPTPAAPTPTATTAAPSEGDRS